MEYMKILFVYIFPKKNCLLFNLIDLFVRFLVSNDEGWQSNSDIYNLIMLFFRFAITPST